MVHVDFSNTRSLIFDLMGTCADWNTSILRALERSPRTELSHQELAAAWRAGFFAEIHARFEAGLAAEDIDVTHRRVLDRLLGERGISIAEWDDAERHRLVRAWHEQTAWRDARDGISRLGKCFDTVVLANGTTRLQLDIVRSAGLPFHSLFSSQLLGLTKPDPRIYRRALELLDVSPDDAVMVAAHAYDLRAAKAIGMKTVYIQRATEDPEEDMAKVRSEVDLFIDGRDGTPTCGLVELARHLNA
ncbi:HAD-like protein [Exidia glandulosa HHB12029]|uniref:HAD-like protein n=1 Tax=Exidia glandulosa HHB12029 TaxID=1314781 RepID=A0A165EK68_EXIGL|nr:HAD-like protein [Exidia glandulosa HHB12029]